MVEREHRQLAYTMDHGTCVTGTTINKHSMKKIISVSKTLPHRRLKKRGARSLVSPIVEPTDTVSDRPKPKKSADDRFFDPRKYQNWLG